MRKIILLNKFLPCGIIFLFVGATASSAIAAHIDESRLCNDKRTVGISQETITLSCKYFTLEDVEEIEREISFEDLKHLYQLLDNSDFYAASLKLDNLGLIPENISVKESVDLMSGRYGKKAFEKYGKQLRNITPKKVDRRIRLNLFNVVSGSSCDHDFHSRFYSRLKRPAVIIGFILLQLDKIMLKFKWYPRWTIMWDWEVGILWYIGDFLISLGYDWENVVHTFFPLKIARCFRVELFDSAKREQASLTTLGLLGYWTMSDYWICVRMFGFTGVFIVEDDCFNEDSCRFMGYSIMTIARN
jgi:hypothetical protein